MERPAASPATFVRGLVDQVCGGQDDIDTVLRKVEMFTSVGAAIGSLEQLTVPHNYSDKGLFGWPVMRLRSPMWWRRLGQERLDKIFGYPNVLGVVGARALAGVGLVLPGASRAQRGAYASTMCVTAHGLHTRMGGYGLDGSDHLAFVSYAVSALEKMFGGDERARETLVRFLAAQVCVAYFTSGAAKLISPVWRDGTAIPDIFRTNMFGDLKFYEAVRDRPWLAKTVAWTTILGEMAFPLVLVAPRPIARGILASGAVFHLSNAHFMGLNRFVWSYCSTYPALQHVARNLGKTPPARTSAAPASAAKALPTAAEAAGDVAGLLRKAASKRSVVAAGAGIVVAAGAAYYATAKRRQRLRRSAPGELIRVRGRDTHVLTSGPKGNGPTVVFENGLASPSTEWGWVLNSLGPDTPYLAYDRSGTGWSATAREPQDAQAVSEHLLALLTELGLKPPYVLVGHSIGGLLIRSFARRNPELTGGLVFLDATHPEQFRRSLHQRESLPWIKQRMIAARLQASVGLLPGARSADKMGILPGELVPATRACMAQPRIWGTASRELNQMQRSWSADAALLPRSPSTPVAVLTAGETAHNDPVHLELQQELAQLSDVSRHDVVDQAGHDTVVLSKPHTGRVVASIEWASAHLSAAAHA
ncbi:alpha/beta fold hydrolase [Streptomyces sp. HC44]|uniref:Alpha/beta fold hydrolase n=1 Tax=Streptomyces scabichelini TaxID=2711217 RepID=A0A6G4UXV3_9ACTN|nr:alpha/beta fold hydrolase [Streptomyces scabichelini]NGO06517.1 alpha/beta fold hydrolase [Streptomyces scabichelini]